MVVVLIAAAVVGVVVGNGRCSRWVTVVVVGWWAPTWELPIRKAETSQGVPSWAPKGVHPHEVAHRR